MSKKHLLVCASTVLLFSALAAKAQDGEVPLQDPSYLPAEGHLISDTEISYERFINRSYQPTYNSGGLNYAYSYSNHSAIGSQSLQYGAAADLAVGLGASCGYRDETYRQAEFGVTYDYHDSAHGCEDPYVQVIYRAIHQTDLPAFPLNVDLTARYAPNLVKGDLAHIEIASGANSGDVNVALSHVFADVTVLGRVGARLVGKAKLSDGGGDYRDDSALARPYLSAESQYRALDDLILLGGATAYPGYRQSQTSIYIDTNIFGFNDIQTQKNSVRFGYEISPYIGAAWTFIPDRLSLSVRYQHSFEGNSRIFYAGSLVNEQTDNGSDYIAIDLRVLWF